MTPSRKTRLSCSAPVAADVHDAPYYAGDYATFVASLPRDDAGGACAAAEGPPEAYGRAARKFFAPNQWPDGLPDFRVAVDAYAAAMRGVAADVFALFEAALDRPVPHDRGMTTFNLAHYGAAASDAGALGIVDHTDWELFTLLYPCFYPRADANPHVKGDGRAYTGLEVFHDGAWVPVPHRPGTLIVNQGEMLSRLSGGELKAPVHRVQAAGAFERHSLVSFWAPNYDVMLPDPTRAGGQVLAGEYYLERNGFLLEEGVK